MKIFEQLPSEFVFAGGGGSWCTILNIEDNGKFSGQYHDSNMVDAGAEYPNGTMYICDFIGEFTNLKKINDYIYSMNIESLELEIPPGTIYYEDGIRYIASEPYGLDNADEFYIYLPGANLLELPQQFLSWAYLNDDIRDTLPSGFYGIYNVGGEQGFVGMDENNIWDGNYIYYYQGRESALRPSYSTVSHLSFWPENGAVVIDLRFTWENDDQTEFEAYDYKGSGIYHISLDISDDQSTIIVTITSDNGIDLSAWGGTSDGYFVAEYTNK